MESIDCARHFKLYADCATTVGEGPLWEAKTNTLYWIDVAQGDIYRMPKGGSPKDFERFQLKQGKIGGIVMKKDGGFLVFGAMGCVWSWRPGEEPVLKAELKEAAPSRFNDIIADPEGRVYCGVAPLQQGMTGSLWRFDPDGSFTCLEKATKGMPNGMAFSPDRKYFYFTVTNERTIYRYHYKQATGELSGRTAFIVVPETEGSPDGMTVDAEGFIWSAQWNGARLVKYSPAGEKLLEYTFPIQKVSCVTFGGPDFTTLFVSTANSPYDEAVYKSSKAGSVFAFERGGRGLPEFAV